VKKRLNAFIDLHRATGIQFLKFGAIGAISFVFDNGFVYFGIDQLGLTRTLAGLFSFPFVAVFSWAGNRYFTFRHARRGSPHAQFIRFVLVCCIGLVFNRGAYTFLVNTVPLVYDHPVLGLLAGTAAGMFFNFFLSRKLVFR
jgi:putative flippase GtrA